MPKLRHFPCCCVAGNIRHIVLLLTIACSSLLFANLLICNVAVLFDNYQDVQLWIKDVHLSSNIPSVQQHRITRTLKPISQNDTVKMFDTFNNVSQQLDDEKFADQSMPNDFSERNESLSFENSISELNDEETTTIRLLANSSTAVDKIEFIAKASHNDTSEKSYKKFGRIDDKDLNENDGFKWIEVEKHKGDDKDSGSKHLPPFESKSVRQLLQHMTFWMAPGLGTLFGAFLAPHVLRTFGARTFFTSAMLISAIATVLLAFAPNISFSDLGKHLIAVLRFSQGLAFSSVFPVIGSMTAQWGTLQRQLSFLIWSSSFIAIAPLASWPVVALLLECRHNWTPFFVHSGLTVLLAITWILFYRDRPQYHVAVNGLELNKIVAGKVRVENNRILAQSPCRVLITSFPVWAIWIAAFGYFMALATIIQFLPIYFLLVIRMDRSDSVTMAALPFIPMFTIILLHSLWHRLAKMCSEIASIHAFTIASFIFCAILFIVFAIFPPSASIEYNVILPFTLIICGLAFATYGILRSATLVGRFFAQFIIGNMQIAVGFGFLLSAMLTTLFVTQNVTGGGWRLVFLVQSAMLLIAAAVFGVFAGSNAEDWSKDSWDLSLARAVNTLEQIDYQTDECGLLEMRVLR